MIAMTYAERRLIREIVFERVEVLQAQQPRRLLRVIELRRASRFLAAAERRVRQDDVVAILLLNVGEVVRQRVRVEDVRRLDPVFLISPNKFYQLDPGRNLGKTNPLNDEDLTEFVQLQKTQADSPKSWSIAAKDIDPATFDLSAKNPSGGAEVAHRSPLAIMNEIAALDAESAKVLAKIRELL